MTSNAPLHPPAPEPTREDVLIGRVVDGEATSADWAALEHLASRDPLVWERLGRAQRTHARLEREVEDAIAIAELIDLPSARAVAVDSFRLRLRQYGGWAAAAAVALAWVGAQTPLVSHPAPTSTAALVPIAAPAQVAPDQLFDRYVLEGVAQGRVVGVMPPVLVRTEPAADGNGKQVIFLRQVLERATMTDVTPVSIQLDEHGTPRYVPTETPIPTLLQPSTGETL
ncbi:MAG: hypothetical protein SFZ24_05830 [Planctomycetota bacterium]|nr:hypothetical protein [Planctomycetota bacterium]